MVSSTLSLFAIKSLVKKKKKKQAADVSCCPLDDFADKSIKTTRRDSKQKKKDKVWLSAVAACLLTLRSLLRQSQSTCHFTNAALNMLMDSYQFPFRIKGGSDANVAAGLLVIKQMTVGKDGEAESSALPNRLATPLLLWRQVSQKLAASSLVVLQEEWIKFNDLLLLLG